MHAMHALPPPAIAAACATPIRGKVLMHASTDTWDIGPTVGLAELDQLAKTAGAHGPHKAYGFYKSDVAYAVTTEIGNAAHDACQGPVIINVTMRLTNRHIGIASDIPADSCRFARISAHYRHHAEADEAVFQTYVLKIVKSARDANIAGLVSGSNGETDRITAAVSSAITPVLDDMDAARTAARAAVDTPEEIARLEAPCSEAFGVRGRTL